MAKERLSKFQKWILKSVLEGFGYGDTYGFFKKEFSGRHRKEIIWDFVLDRLYPNKRDRFEEKEGTFFMWDFNEKKRTNQKKKYYKVKEKYIITRSEEAIISRSLLAQALLLTV